MTCKTQEASQGISLQLRSIVGRTVKSEYSYLHIFFFLLKIILIPDTTICLSSDDMPMTVMTTIQIAKMSNTVRIMYALGMCFHIM